MIARWWTGSVPREKGSSYLAYLEETGVAALRNTPGNRGVYVLQRQIGDVIESVVLSLWDSLDSIRAFAGDDVEIARYYPRDPEFLFSLSKHVTHFDAKAWLPPARLAHVDLRVTDRDAARRFYDTIMPAVGYTALETGDGWVSYKGRDDGSFIWFQVEEARPEGIQSGRVAFRVPARSDVDAAGALLQKAGATSIEGPMPYPEYADSYYAVFFEDRDGNKFEVYTK